jgi:glycosyltransferase involved in cell wall biosynthesis
MNVHFNTMVKNEGLLLDRVLPIWKTYDVDQFVFYDDNSTDNTLEVIAKHLPAERYVIYNDKLPAFNEAYHRSKMLQHSRKKRADYVLSIDADELLSANLCQDLRVVLKDYDTRDIWLFWYNVVNDSLNQTRNDPAYVNNYRSFILPLKHTGNLDLSQWKYHTPRVPAVNLPKTHTKDYGILHLQAINRRFYALKQLWYKHYELVNYDHSIENINGRYDPVVNGLNFCAVQTPASIVGDLGFDSSVFDGIEEIRQHKKYVLEHLHPALITFGKEYLGENK